MAVVSPSYLDIADKLLQVTSWDGYIAKYEDDQGKGGWGQACGRHGKITEMQTGLRLG